MDFRIPKICQVLKSFTRSFQQTRNLLLISEDFSQVLKLLKLTDEKGFLDDVRNLIKDF